MATSTTLIAGKTLALNAAQTSSAGSSFTLQNFTNRFVGDYNGDGKLDIVAEDGTSAAMVMLGNGDGTFGAAQTATQATAATLAGTADVNGQLLAGNWTVVGLTQKKLLNKCRYYHGHDHKPVYS